MGTIVARRHIASTVNLSDGLITAFVCLKEINGVLVNVFRQLSE